VGRSIASADLIFGVIVRLTRDHVPRHPDAAVNDQQAVNDQDNALCVIHGCAAREWIHGSLAESYGLTEHTRAAVPLGIGADRTCSSGTHPLQQRRARAWPE